MKSSAERTNTCFRVPLEEIAANQRVTVLSKLHSHRVGVCQRKPGNLKEKLFTAFAALVLQYTSSTLC